MPDVNPLLSNVAPPQNTAAPRAGGNNASNAADNDDKQQHFANVLRDKTANTQAPKNDARAPAQADTDKSKVTAKDAKDAKDEDKSDDKSKPADPKDLAAALMAAAQQQQPAPPDATVAAAAAAAAAAANAANSAKTDVRGGTTAGDGKDVLGLGGDARAGAGRAADPRAGLFTDTAAGAQADAAGAKTGAGSFDSTLDTLMGRLRQEAGKDGDPKAATDSSTSTLAMLMPANQTTQAQQTAAVQRPSTLIEAPVGSPLFADEAAQRVTWLAKSGVEHAEIRVTPPDMGPIQVSIEMKQNEATINFTVHQTDTRVAVEDSLHRLEAMLADSGISLAQANVGQGSAGQSQAGGGSGNRGSGRGTGGSGNGGDGGNAGGIDAVGGASPRQGGVRGLVDTFA